jgi:hypothetical protein
MQQISARSIQTGNVPEVVAGLPIVNLWYRGRSIGLYRVRDVADRAIVLKHGAISFPVGTLLDVVDFQNVIPNAPAFRLSTTVVGNDHHGISLAW